MSKKNLTKQIQKATAVLEVVKKRITYRGPEDRFYQTDVVDSLVLIPKKMQKTFFAAVRSKLNAAHYPLLDYKYVQVINGRPVAAFLEGDLLVVP